MRASKKPGQGPRLIAPVRWQECSRRRPVKRRQRGRTASQKLSIVEKSKNRRSAGAEVRPMLQRDHGDVELADVQEQDLCAPSGRLLGLMWKPATLGGIQQR